MCICVQNCVYLCAWLINQSHTRYGLSDNQTCVSEQNMTKIITQKIITKQKYIKAMPMTFTKMDFWSLAEAAKYISRKCHRGKNKSQFLSLMLFFLFPDNCLLFAWLLFPTFFHLLRRFLLLVTKTFAFITVTKKIVSFRKLFCYFFKN